MYKTITKKLSSCCGVLTYVGSYKTYELARATNPVMPARLFELCESCGERVIAYEDVSRSDKELIAACILQGMVCNPKSQLYATSPGETMETVKKLVMEVLKNGIS